MKNRRALWAILGAGLLTLGVTSTAMAVVLTQDHEAIVAGWDEDGDPFAVDSGGDPFPVNPPACDGFEVADAEILFHFVQSGDGQDPTTPNPGGPAANLLDVDLNDGEIFLTDVEASDVGAESVDWFVSVNPPGDELELVSATSDVDGGELVVAHICINGLAAGATNPDTATAGNPATGSPADGAWLLVVALGVFLVSIVVINPARGTSRR